MGFPWRAFPILEVNHTILAKMLLAHCLGLSFEWKKKRQEDCVKR